jgi:putative cell wall-binding protein
MRQIWATAAVVGLLLLGVVTPAAAAGTGSMSGTVRNPDGSLADTFEVIALDLSTGQSYTFSEESAAGAYSLPNLPEGDYRVRFYSGDLDGYWGEEPWLPLGVEVALVAGENKTLDYTYTTRASVQGQLSCALCASPNYEWAHPYFGIQALRPDGTWTGTRFNTSTPFPTTPHYGFSTLLPGTYRISTQYEEETGPLWGWGFSPSFTLTAGQTATVNFSVSMPPSTTRIDGPDRFAVAVGISKRFPVGVDTVYVANGLNFPDALGAAPVAALAGAPLLLVTPDSVPPVVLAEIKRLSPSKIVIVGGTPSVSSAVQSVLASVGSVERLAGADRFATSIDTARHGFPDGADIMYIATGLNFPDALSAGPAAAQHHAPVVIVNGGATTAPAQLRTLIEDLGVEEVRLVGSDASVSAGVAASIQSWGVAVSRLAGADRYATSAIVNASGNFGPAPRLYLAVGTRFPDALAGGALAGFEGVPLLISQPECMNPSIRTALSYGLNPDSVVLLGSTAALAPPAALFQRC